MEQESSAPIIPPADFPIIWDDPADEQRYWIWDQTHGPTPITPLTTFLIDAINHGLAHRERLFKPALWMRYRRINTYLYSSLTQVVPPEQKEAQDKRSEESMEGIFPRLGEAWTNELLPQVMHHLAFWQDFDLHAASTSALLRHLEETRDRLNWLWDTHFWLVFPCGRARSLFLDLYRELFGEESTFEGLQLLQGYDNSLLQANRALWCLGRKIAESATLCQIVESAELPEIGSTLQASAEGQAFLAELQAFLETYGRRSSEFGELANPGWIEDPTPVYKYLKDHAAHDDVDPQKRLQLQAGERDRLLARVRERIQGYPQAVRDQFENRLAAAQHAAFVAEDHNYWIDFRAAFEVRRVLREFGRRFVEAGIIDQEGDVFYLYPEELVATAHELLGEGHGALDGRDRRELVAARRAEMERFRKVTPPRHLGTPLPRPASGTAVKEGTGASAAEPGVIRGSPGSPGTARGVARVARTLEEAERLRPGEVLVAITTAPPWTPLFAVAGAIVTDAGGILSHSAVVAREYSLPAVTGTGTGTTAIRDGQVVEVDGSAGIVRIISEG